MSRPSRGTTAGRVYLDLRARARREGRPTDELLVLYVLERFLYRLSVSRHRTRLILKGGMLLAAWNQRRPTRDVDLLAKAVSNDVGVIRSLINDVLAIEVGDAVTYDPAGMKVWPIREGGTYEAVRIAVAAQVDRARHPLRIDVNVGDPVTPGPVETDYPALLGEPFRVVGYPIEMVLAEKIVTMIERGDATTRERDFADVVLLIGSHSIEAARVSAAIAATATYRNTALRPLRDVLLTLGRDRQGDWRRLLAHGGLEQRLPSSYQEAVEHVAAFADPLLTRSVATGRWNYAQKRWQP